MIVLLLALALLSTTVLVRTVRRDGYGHRPDAQNPPTHRVGGF